MRESFLFSGNYVWNIKTGDGYRIEGFATNKTSDVNQDGKTMVIYYHPPTSQTYVREKSDFMEKFTDENPHEPG